MKIVFFDGYCSLCDSLIDWLMRADQSREIKFASLQGETARQMGVSTNQTDFETIVYLRDTVRYERSNAILQILIDLGGVWRWSRLLYVFPEFVRNFVYRWVAKNRYRYFPKRDTCRLPTPEEKDRLLP